MLSFATMQLVYQVTSHLWHWGPQLAINLVSCLMGAGAMAVAWVFTSDCRHRALSFALIATAGFTLLFFGHIETYACPATAFLLMALCAKGSLRWGWSTWPLVASFSLMAWLHLVALFALPAVGFTLWLVWCERRPTGVELRHTLLAASPLLMLWLSVWVYHCGSGELLEGGGFFHSLTRRNYDERYALLSMAHLRETGFFLWRSAGLAAPLAVWALVVRRRDRLTQALAGLLLCYLYFLVTWHPDAGQRDWDLFTFPGIICVLIVADALDCLPRSAVWAWPVVAVNLLTVMPEAYSNARLGERGHALIALADLPEGTVALLDNRLPLSERPILVMEGLHTLRVIDRIESSHRFAISVRPGENQTLTVVRGELERLR